MSARSLSSLGFAACLFVGCAVTTPSALPTLAPTTLPMPTRTLENPDTPNPTATLSAIHNMKNLIPKPVSVTPTQGIFILNDSTKIVVPPNDAALERIAKSLASNLNAAIGFSLQVVSENDANGNIVFALHGEPALGDEGYALAIAPGSILLTANTPAGIFYGTQTLRQLVPPTPADTPIGIAAGDIRDAPRFSWRGTMLDVARHFFKVEDVKKYIDVLAYYKLNRLHLHLTDDQGWRIEIKAWDKLATHGGSTQVGGGKGGYYTQAEYQELVDYAAQHYITVIPEIDMPGHTNAALASYAELNCDDTARELYTGTSVGFSSLCADKEITYKFIEDVVRELAALTPAPYLHIGGDEAHSTDRAAYISFVQRVQEIVQQNGKQMIGWGEIAQARLQPTSVVQHWYSDVAAQTADQGAHFIMSPASKAYLDMKYDETTKLGLDWAGLIDVETAYSWEPGTQLEDVSERDILGVEAPLWSETLETLDDIEFMAFPRLIGIAEIGWSPPENRAWDEYVKRLATHGARLKALGVIFFESPQVSWE